MDSNLFVIIISYRLTYKATEGKQILLRNTATIATFIGQKLIERLNVIRISVNQNKYDRDELREWNSV